MMLKSGTVVVRNENCFDAIPSLRDESVDCVITDPPYFIDGFNSAWAHSEVRKKVPKEGVVTSMPKGMKFDPDQGRKLEAYINTLSELLMPKMKPGAFFLCFSMARLQHRMATGIENAGFEIRDALVWKRRSQPKSMRLNHLVDISRAYNDAEKRALKEKLARKRTPQPTVLYESIVMAQKPREATFIENWRTHKTGLINATDAVIGNIIDMPKERTRINHMTVKPLPLIKKLLSVFTDADQLVLDPFVGSGTTALACKQMDRRCIGYELDKEHYRLCESRLKTCRLQGVPAPPKTARSASRDSVHAPFQGAKKTEGTRRASSRPNAAPLRARSGFAAARPRRLTPTR